MTVTDNTFPQSGDADFAENFATWLGRGNISSYVETGLDFTPDYADNLLDISQGKGFVVLDQKEISSNDETRLVLDYAITTSARTGIGLNASETNNLIYLVPNLTTNDSPSFSVETSTGAAGSEWLLIGVVDTVNNTVTLRNREPSADFNSLSVRKSLDIPAYAEFAEATNSESNIIYIDGSGTPDAGIYFNDGSGYTNAGIREINKLNDVTGVASITADSETNRPAAGEAGRIFIDETNNKVQRDTGSMWVNIGVNASNISATDLGFDPATQPELDAHASDGDAHHAKTSTIDELSDVDFTDIEVNTESNRPAAGTNGRFFLARDTQNLFYDNGSSWVKVGTASHDNLEDISSDDHHIRPAAGTNLSEDANQNFNLVQGSGSSLNADLLDGVHLANISLNDIDNLSFEGVLDADTLDGVELADIAPTDVSTTSFDGRYVTESGDTMAGDLDLAQNEIRSAVIHKLSSDPSSPVVGQMWYRTDLD